MGGITLCEKRTLQYSMENMKYSPEAKTLMTEALESPRKKVLISKKKVIKKAIKKYSKVWVEACAKSGQKLTLPEVKRVFSNCNDERKQKLKMMDAREEKTKKLCERTCTDQALKF